MLAFASKSLAQSTARFPAPPGASTAAPSPSAPSIAASPSPRGPSPTARARSAPSVAEAAAVTAAPPPDDGARRHVPVAAAPLAPSRLGSDFYPALLPYRQGLPIPPGYRVEHRAANGLIGGGLATWVIAYATAIAVGASAKFEDGTGWLLVPVLGPWAAIGARSYACDDDPLHANRCVNGAFNEVQTMAILSADAVVQATGAVLFITGLASGHDELVRSDLPLTVRVSPRVLGASGFGLGFDGRF